MVRSPVLPTTTPGYQTNSVGTKSEAVKVRRLPRAADIDDDDTLAFPIRLNPLRGTALAIAAKHKHTGLIHRNPDAFALVVGANIMRPTTGSKAIARIQVRSLAISVSVEFYELFFGHWCRPCTANCSASDVPEGPEGRPIIALNRLMPKSSDLNHLATRKQHGAPCDRQIDFHLLLRTFVSQPEEAAVEVKVVEQ